MNISDYKYVYFLGIGGIGMSALARYFNGSGYAVAGYDKTDTKLTKQLVSENIPVVFQEDVSLLPKFIAEKSDVLIVYTPAIPKDNLLLQFFIENGFLLKKRSEVLGLITKDKKCLAVAGTHGKTTTSCMLSHVLFEVNKGINAFLGGISSNFNTNVLVDENSDYVVVEADEFDRSFLTLHPFASILTSTDADHLDIYGDDAQIKSAFQDYVNLIPSAGFLVKQLDIEVESDANILTYAIDDNRADFYAKNLVWKNDAFYFDLYTPNDVFYGVELGIPGIHNVENALAVIALTFEIGCEPSSVIQSLKSFSGVKRRFEFLYNASSLKIIDDYAHHPTAIQQLVKSIRLLYPDQRVIGVFQPHLFSRTRDFLNEFAKALDLLDELVLLPIYPARELPIDGVSSEALLNLVSVKDKSVKKHHEVFDYLLTINKGVLLTIGAGDIDLIANQLSDHYNQNVLK